MNRKTLFLIPVILLLSLPVRAQEETWRGPYRIAGVEYHIEGKTKERPLREYLEIKIGKEFEDLASLDAYVADKRQLLINQRIFASADITYVLGEAEDGVMPVTLEVYTKDTWNLIALPYPKYTTNDGLLLSVRARDYNFLGSMNPLYVDLNYVNDENGDTSFGLGVDFTLPFGLLGQDWSVQTDQYFAVDLNGLITYTDYNTLEMYLYTGDLKWTFSLEQNILWNASGEDDYDLNKLVLQTIGGIDTKIGLWDIGGLGTLNLTPSVSVGKNYLTEGEISEERRGAYITASYSLDAGRADWIGNFRKGLVLYLNNAYTYNLEKDTWTITGLGEASYYSTWNNRVGLNSRLVLYGQMAEDKDNDIGSYMRGIPDENLDGDLAAFINLDLPVRLFDVKPSLLIKKDWFDFEAHASPFVDAALVRYDSESPFEPYLTGGIELFGFLKQARSIYARLSVGVNVLGYLDTNSLTNNYEIFFGIGHDY